MNTVPITERPNSITTHIDTASSVDIVSLLQQSDQQMFAGYETFPSMVDQAVCATITQIADVARELLSDTCNNTIVLGGSGTSGRFAFLTARAMNQALVRAGRAPCFQYLCVGGDPSLFQSKEAPEDNWHLGIEQLKGKLAGKHRAMYIGITCGLSAPVVAGQLKHCLDHIATVTPVLLGFNDLALARNVPIEGWTMTCKDVIMQLHEAAQAHSSSSSSSGAAHPAFIINPAVGPESITGSTRMKGGSATKVILETIFALALQPAPALCTPVLLEEYGRGIEETYRAKASIAQAISLAGHALRDGHRVLYLGQRSFGIMGLIDASECPPTYNAHPNDVRAFVDGGFATLQNVDGDLEPRGPEFLLSWESYEQHFLPSVSEGDLVVCLNDAPVVSPDLARLARLSQEHSARVVLISLLPRGAQLQVQ